MCLSIPSKIISIYENNMALVDTLGVHREVTLDLISEPLKEGDYVLIHVGFAMGKIDEKDALETLAIYEEIAKSMEDEPTSQEIGDTRLIDGLNKRLQKS